MIADKIFKAKKRRVKAKWTFLDDEEDSKLLRESKKIASNWKY